MTRRALIGITCGTEPRDGSAQRFGLNHAYVRAVEAAGGVVVMVPPSRRAAVLELVGRLDGLLVPGGADVEPSRYRQATRAELDGPDPARDETEIAAVRAAVRRSIPVFGICRGMQLINVAFGGTLVQDIAVETGSEVPHGKTPGRGRGDPAHDVDISPRSWFAETARATRLPVNSSHHQAVLKAGRGLMVTATSPDGVIEGIESADRGVVAVQCHPEEMTVEAWARALFRSFVTRAAGRQ